jgi:hypothetical protein
MAKTDTTLEKKGTNSVAIVEQVKTQIPIAGTSQLVKGETIISGSVQADPRLEYVAAGGDLWLTRFLQSLPWYIDDVTRDFGPDLYERMLLDAQVAADFDTLKMGILRDELKILPKEDEKDDKSTPSLFGNKPRQSSDQSKTIADFCSRCLDRLQRPIMQTLDEMLNGIAYGNKVAELIYEVPDTGPLANMLALKAIKVKSRESTAFVIDAYSNVIGLMGLIPGQGYPVAIGGYYGDPGKVQNLLPREKFAVFTWRSKNGDPRGTSHLRGAYTPWWLKQQLYGEWLKYATLFATPSVAGTVSEKAQPVPVVDANGNPTGVVIQPEQAMLTALESWKNASSLALPYGSEIEIFEAKRDGVAFSSFVAYLDSQISKRILLQTLASNEAKHQSKSAGEVHQDIMALIVAYGKQTTVDMIVTDILRPLVKYNFGEDALDLMPIVTLGDTESQDFAEAATAIAALATAGYLDDSQYDHIDQDLGLPARAAGWIEKKQAAATALAAKPAPAVPAKTGGANNATK